MRHEFTLLEDASKMIVTMLNSVPPYDQEMNIVHDKAAIDVL
jgi:hypothetical protein